MRRLAWLFSVLSIAGCGAGDDCQGTGGVFFDSADADAAMATAVGGKQRFVGSTDACLGREVFHDELLAVTEDPTVATVQVVDGTVEVTGVRAGTASVHVTSKQGGAAASFDVIAIDHVALSGQTGNVVFPAATPYAEIQLLGAGNVPCVDRTLSVTGPLPLGDRWDRLVIGNAAAGDYVETIHAGGSDWPVTVKVE